jgi:hypothetical protein
MNNPNQRSTGTAEEIIRAKEKKTKDESGPLYVLNNELRAFLNLLHLPASLNKPQTAALLGFRPHDIPVLAARGFLTPLGNPNSNCDKFYARVKIEELALDEKWLSRARAALHQHWRIKNARKNKSARPD